VNSIQLTYVRGTFFLYPTQVLASSMLDTGNAMTPASPVNV
jgi:hypothetical protein